MPCRGFLRAHRRSLAAIGKVYSNVGGQLGVPSPAINVFQHHLQATFRGPCDDGKRQRAAPVVVPEGPSAGGGVRSTVVDPGVPLGPGLVSTWPLFHGPHVRMTSTRTNAAAIMP